MKISRFMLKYSEILSLIVLCYFSGSVSLWFSLPFAAVLISVALVRSQHEPPDEASLAGICAFSAEVSCIFLAYCKAPVIGCLVITAVGVGLLFLLERDYLTLPDTETLGKGIMILGIIGYAGAFLIGKNVAAIAMTWLIFCGALLFLPNSVLTIAGLVTGCSVLLIGVGEIGTIFVLVLSAALYLLITGNLQKQTFVLTCGGSLFAIWLSIYTSNGLFRRVYAFFNYAKTDQLTLIAKLARRPFKEMLLLLLAPAEQADILMHDTSTYTAVADYAYDLARFSTGLYAVLFAVLMIACYALSIWRHRRSRLMIIPAMLFTQGAVHILGNTMTGVFSGLPLPFFSYGNNQLIVCFILLIVLTNAELRGDYP